MTEAAKTGQPVSASNLTSPAHQVSELSAVLRASKRGHVTPACRPGKHGRERECVCVAPGHFVGDGRPELFGLADAGGPAQRRNREAVLCGGDCGRESVLGSATEGCGRRQNETGGGQKREVESGRARGEPERQGKRGEWMRELTRRRSSRERADRCAGGSGPAGWSLRTGARTSDARRPRRCRTDPSRR